MPALTRTFVIRYPKGLHARPSALLVDRASRFAADLTIRHGAKCVSLKSLLGVMTLAAPHGAEVAIDADGDDAAAALDALAELLDAELDL